MEAALRALSHPVRRQMLELVWDGERSSSEVAATVGVSRPVASQHLKVLRDAGLVVVHADGNRRLYRVDVDGLAAVRAELERFWHGRLADLGARASEEEKRRRER
jgi:DNA-binding transcriptional ArsR family regulator